MSICFFLSCHQSKISICLFQSDSSQEIEEKNEKEQRCRFSSILGPKASIKSISNSHAKGRRRTHTEAPIFSARCRPQPRERRPAAFPRSLHRPSRRRRPQTQPATGASSGTEDGDSVHRVVQRPLPIMAPAQRRGGSRPPRAARPRHSAHGAARTLTRHGPRRQRRLPATVRGGVASISRRWWLRENILINRSGG